MTAEPKNRSEVVVDVESRRSHTLDSFVDVLWERSRQTRGLRKGERTRARLRAAAVDTLEKIGYRDMTVADICKVADLTPGSLYLYYDSKSAIVTEVLTEFLNEFFATSKPEKPKNLYQSVYEANLRWLNMARANSGLMRCLLQLREDEPSFASLYFDANKKWYDRSVSAWRKHFKPGSYNDATALIMAYVIGGLMDEVVRLLFINPDPNFKAVIDQAEMTDQHIAEMIALTWYRSLVSKSPDSGVSPHIDKLFSPFRVSKKSIASLSETDTSIELSD